MDKLDIIIDMLENIQNEINELKAGMDIVNKNIGISGQRIIDNTLHLSKDISNLRKDLDK